MTIPKPLKTIRSYVDHAIFLYNGLRLDDEGLPVVVREIPRPSNIPSPYRHSSEWPVYDFQGQEVVIAETAHRCYQVFRVEDCNPSS